MWRALFLGLATQGKTDLSFTFRPERFRKCFDLSCGEGSLMEFNLLVLARATLCVWKWGMLYMEMKLMSSLPL